MNIQNLLCHSNDTYTTHFYVDEQYDKQAFDYCPSSPSAWSSITTKTYMSEPLTTEVNSMNASVHSSSSTVSSSKRTHHRQHQTRTPWTASEDYLLEKGYLQGLSWAMISAKYLPHRSRGCCWGRFKTLQTKSTEKKNWTESEDRILIGAIRKNTKLFKEAWKTVALDLKNRDWRECEIRSARIAGISMIQKRKSLT